MKPLELPTLARHWLPYALGGVRSTHGFVPREKGQGRGFVSLCKRAVLARLADALEGSAPICRDCSAEGDRRLRAWRQRAGVSSSSPEASRYSEHLEEPDDPDPYA